MENINQVRVLGRPKVKKTDPNKHKLHGQETLIREFLASGTSLMRIAKICEVDRHTLTKYINEHTELKSMFDTMQKLASKSKLDGKENAIRELIIGGHTQVEIAAIFNVSRTTVCKYIKDVISKGEIVKKKRSYNAIKQKEYRIRLAAKKKKKVIPINLAEFNAACKERQLARMKRESNKDLMPPKHPERVCQKCALFRDGTCRCLSLVHNGSNFAPNCRDYR